MRSNEFQMTYFKFVFSWPLLLLIRAYWYFVNRNHRRCLFKTTCSRAAYNATLEKGLLGGIKCILSRFKICRDGYKLIEDEYQNKGILTVDGEFYPLPLLADWLKDEFKS